MTDWIRWGKEREKIAQAQAKKEEQELRRKKAETQRLIRKLTAPHRDIAASLYFKSVLQDINRNVWDKKGKVVEEEVDLDKSYANEYTMFKYGYRLVYSIPNTIYASSLGLYAKNREFSDEGVQKGKYSVLVESSLYYATADYQGIYPSPNIGGASFDAEKIFLLGYACTGFRETLADICLWQSRNRALPKDLEQVVKNQS